MSMTNTMRQVQWEYDRQMPPQLPCRDEMYFGELYDVRRDIRECRWEIENLIEKLDCLTEREREICGELENRGYILEDERRDVLCVPDTPALPPVEIGSEYDPLAVKVDE